MRDNRSSARRRITALVAAPVVLLGMFVDAGVARAADSDFLFYGQAAGAEVQASNSAAPSSLAASTGVLGGPTEQTSSGQIAAAKLQGVLDVGSISTSAQITAVTGGWKVVSTAKAANVNMLGGAITATSVTTRSAISEIGGILTTSVVTTFVNLHIVGINVPASIPQNYNVKLGSIGNVTLDAAAAAVGGTTAVATGTGIRVVLLEPAGSANTGAVLSVGPTQAIVRPVPTATTGHTNSGQAYATKVTANVGSLVGVMSNPTAPVTVFAGGTDGATVANSVASVHIATGLNVGAATDTGFGMNTTAGATTITTSKIVHINLFNGLIKANTLAVAAVASSNGTISGTLQLVNLVIAGKPISANTPANTTINLPRLGTVIVNQQIRTAHGITVRGIDIVMLVKRNGLPIGTELQIGVAAASAA